MAVGSEGGQGLRNVWGGRPGEVGLVEEVAGWGELESGRLEAGVKEAGVRGAGEEAWGARGWVGGGGGLCYYTIILTSTSPSEIADYTVVLVYFYATILLYLPLLHRVKLLVPSLYYYINLFFSIIMTSTSPTETANYIAILLSYCTTLLFYLPSLHHVNLLIPSLYYYIHLFFSIILTSTSPSGIADYIVISAYSYATRLLYLPLLRPSIVAYYIVISVIMLLYYYTFLYFTV